MLPVQILLTFFFLFAVIKVVGRYRAQELSLRAMIAWVLFWIAAVIITVAPNSTAYFAMHLGIGRGADLVVYCALVGLFFIVFRLMVKMEKQSREITALTRKIALENKVVEIKK